MTEENKDNTFRQVHELNGNFFILPHPKGHLNKCIGLTLCIKHNCSVDDNFNCSLCEKERNDHRFD
jgi:hypothetical protein